MVRWKRFSAVGSAPVLCVRWHVSHPISSAAWRLPLSDTCSPVLWQLRQRFSFSSPDFGFDQLILVVARVRVMARQAIAHRRRMHRSLDIRSLLVRMATDAKRNGRRRDQLYPRHILGDPDLMAAQAPALHRRVNKLVFGLVVVALQALLGVGILVQRNRVHRRHRPQSQATASRLCRPCRPAGTSDAPGRQPLCGTMRDEGTIS